MSGVASGRRAPRRPATALLAGLLSALVTVPAVAAPLVPPGVGELLRPTFSRADLRRAAERLGLDEERRASLETRRREYEAACAEGVAPVRAAIAALRPAGAVSSVERLARQRRVDEDLRALMEGSAGDPARLEMLAARAREHVGQVQRETAETPPMPPAARAEALATLAARLETWQRRRRELADGLLDDLAGVAGGDGRAAAVRRALWRRVLLPRGRLESERADLTLVIERLGVVPEPGSELEAALLEYERRLDEALHRREAHRHELDRLLLLADPDDREPLAAEIERHVGRCVAVRDLNDRFAGSLTAALPGRHSGRFGPMSRAAIRPSVFRVTRAQRLLTEASRLRGLQGDRVPSVHAVRSSCDRERRTINDRLLTMTRECEPDRLRRGLRREAGLGAEPPCPGLAAVFRARGRTERHCLRALSVALGPTLAEQLGLTARDAEAPPSAPR
ncbi:MAG: hypothetical protein ACYTG1_09250 [Planctomycetota bacterium]|jgi:hypothetical protein